MKSRVLFAAIGLVTMALLAVEATDAWARATGGGSRGSRSYSAPARPAPSNPGTATSPRRGSDPTPMAPRPSPFGGFGGLLGGLLIGGLLGGLLFGHHGFGIGLLDILLVVGGVLVLVAVLRSRRAPRPEYAMAGGGGARDPGGEAGASAATMEVPPAMADLERGLGHIHAMDPRFDPAAFADTARQAFLDVQRAVGARDVAPLRDRITPEMYGVLLTQSDELRAARRTNRVEGVEFSRADVSEAWQENGRDFVTVYLAGSLLDYTVDDASGAVVEGSRSEPQRFEEFWTFTRPVGPNGWRLSAIQAS